MKYEMQELRLQFWDCLLHDALDEEASLDQTLLAFTRAGDYEDKKAFALLKACVAVSKTASHAMKRNLKAAIITWFGGGANAENTTSPQLAGDSMPHLYEIVGAELTWRDAAKIVGINPDDYSAKHRILDILRDECARQWKSSFGDGPRGPFEVADG